MDQLALLQRKLEREQRARRQAEEIAEAKTRELYAANQELRAMALGLEGVVAERTRDLERALLDLRVREEEARKLSNVASRTDNMVIISDANGDIEWVNRAFEELTGWSLDEVVGRRPGKFLQGPDTDPETVEFMRSRIHAQQGFTCEVVNYARSGRRYWVAIEVQPVYDDRGQLTNFIAIESDITEAKESKEALAAARDQALEASRLKSEFLATMSHEIRTPMNGIIGMAELLLDTDLTAEQREFGAIVLTEAQHLLTIINDILDFSKIEAERITLDSHDFELLSLVERLVDAMSVKAHEQGTDLMTYVDPAIPATLLGDSARLRQLLLNLVGNAIKFTSGGSVVVSATLQEPAGEHALVRFEISDTGIGMPPDVLERIRAFRPFTQADSSITRRYGGTGLGLPICHGLVTLMGGTLSIESQAGVGTQVSFAIPLTIAQPSPQTASAPDQEVLRGMNVLIVDDNPTHRAILQRTVASWGLTSQGAHSGAEALQMLRSPANARPIHLVLTDLVMPGMDGSDLALAIRADPTLAHLPIILITAYDVQISDQRLQACNFARTLTKPIRQSQLFDAIADAAATIDLTPPAPAGPEADPTRVSPETPSQGPTVLVAEDNRTNQVVARHQLQRLGFTSIIVEDGMQAVEAIRQAARPYVLVLMDVQMPGMDGLEATREIRRLEDQRGGNPIPIIAMTAQALKGDRERCLAAGMNDYISKPVQLGALREALQRWFTPS